MNLALVALATLAADPEPIPVAIPARSAPVSYAREISDILDAKCAGCHGAALSEGKLNLESVASMLKGGKHGPALVGGQADESLLFRMAAHRVEPVMPPKDKAEHRPLAPEELGLLKLWIDSGAKDDSAEVAADAEPIELGNLPPGVHPIVAVDLTADGKVVACGRANLVQVYDADSGLLVASLSGHKDIVQSLRFSPDGRTLAAGSYRIVTRWNLPRTAEKSTLSGHGAAARALAISADGKLLYSCGDDATIRVWNADEGKGVRPMSAPASTCLALAPDGKTLAAGGPDGVVRILSAEDGKELARLDGHGAAIEGVGFLGVDRLVSAGRDGTARIWSTNAGGGAAPIVLRGHAGPVLSVAATPDGSKVVTGGEDKTARVWDAASGAMLRLLVGHEGPVRAVAASPKGDAIATGAGDETVRLWSLGDGRVLHAFDGLRAGVASVAFSPTGDRLAAATGAGGAKIWDVAGGRGVAAFGHLGDDPKAPPPALHAAIFVGESTLATASTAKTIKLWACDGSWFEAPPLGPHAFRVLALDFSPDGRLLAAGGGEPSRSGEVKVWDAESGSLVRTLPDALHSDTVFGLAFSPDGKALASGSADKFVKVTTVADGKEAKSFEGHTGHVLSVDWGEDGKKLVSGGADNVLRLWDYETGDAIRTLQAAGKQVTSVRWGRGAGNSSIAGASGDRLVRFWNPADGGVPRTFSGPSDYVFGVAVSKDNKRVAAGGADGVLFLWDGETGNVLRRLGP